MGHFLLVVLWAQVSISNGFRDILPKHHVLIDTMVNRHCECAISRDEYPYVKFKYIIISISHPSLCLFTMALSLGRAPMKNKGFYLSGPLMLKAKSSEHFLSPKICEILTF